MNFFTFFSAGASGRVTLTNVDAASGSVPVPLQRLAPFDCVLVDAPCTSVTQPAESDRIAPNLVLTVLLVFFFKSK